MVRQSIIIMLENARSVRRQLDPCLENLYGATEIAKAGPRYHLSRHLRRFSKAPRVARCRQPKLPSASGASRIFPCRSRSIRRALSAACVSPSRPSAICFRYSSAARGRDFSGPIRLPAGECVNVGVFTLTDLTGYGSLNASAYGYLEAN